MSNQGYLLPLLYQCSRANGWSNGMRQITHALLTRHGALSSPILELGCGAGLLTAELQQRLPCQLVAGIDLHPDALAYAQARCHLCQLTQADLQQLPYGDNAFGLVLALDVFDQAAVDLPRALQESWRVLRPHGLLLMRLGVHRWLQGAHDTAFNTGQRYAQHEVILALAQQGFVPVRITFANTLLAPLLIALRLLQRWRFVPLRESLYTAPMLNWLLALALQWETRWLQGHNFAFGISLFILAFAVK